MGRAGARLKCSELTDAVLYTDAAALRDVHHEMYFEDHRLEKAFQYT
jgi:hypothetical protein